jgi:hypothetical protein
VAAGNPPLTTSSTSLGPPSGDHILNLNGSHLLKLAGDLPSGDPPCQLSLATVKNTSR